MTVNRNKLNRKHHVEKIRNRHRRRNRRNQSRSYLRRITLRSNHGRCIVSGYTNTGELEAAHIVPRAIGVSIEFPYVNTSINTISLNSGLHALFDRFEWTFDIYRFLNEGVTSETSFTTTMLAVVKPQNRSESSIAREYGRLISIDIKYLPSLYLHYHVYLQYNYMTRRGGNSLEQQAAWFQTYINTDTYRRLLNCRTVTDAKNVLLTARETNNYIAIVDNRLNKGVRQYLVCWEYYDQTNWTWEPEENIAGYGLDTYKSAHGLRGS